MEIKLAFLGAAQNVTGSRFMLETNGSRVLVDCGLYQERKLRNRNWDPFPVPPANIDAVLLTHAHLDHCGLLPKLVREGFKGKIYCTAATSELTRIIILDSAKIQEEDAKYKRKRHEREGRKGPYPEVPLYEIEDAEAVLPLFSSVSYEKPARITDGIEATFHDAGHVFGSSSISVKVGCNGNERTIVFSGDVGRWDKPILRDPVLIDHADYALVESTYGDRVHHDKKDIDDMLAEIITSTHRRGGKIFIPSFALERTQEVLYQLNQLLLEKRIPQLPAFVDSPMAVRITDVFENHPELFDKEMTALIKNHESPFHFPGLTLVRSVDESKAINQIKGSAIVIAGSGMCTGGRIKHHLFNNISKPEHTVVFVGYQASGTLGRHILEGAEEARILGQKHPIKARIERINGFSAHADREELHRWLSGFQKPPKHLFIVHGEPDSANNFAKFIKSKTGWENSVPEYQDEVVLD